MPQRTWPSDPEIRAFASEDLACLRKLGAALENFALHRIELRQCQIGLGAEWLGLAQKLLGFDAERLGFPSETLGCLLDRLGSVYFVLLPGQENGIHHRIIP